MLQPNARHTGTKCVFVGVHVGACFVCAQAESQKNVFAAENVQKKNYITFGALCVPDAVI